MSPVAPAPLDAPPAAPAAAAAPPALRLALCLAGPQWPRVLVEALCRLHADGPARIVRIVLDRPPGSALSPAWRLYRQIDAWLSGQRRGDLQATDLPAALAGVPLIAAADPACRDTLQADAPDAILQLGEPPAADLLGLARYGLWRLSFGEPANSAAGGEGFQAVAAGRSLGTVRLSAQLGDGREKLLCQSSTRTLPLSLSQNRARLLRRAAALPGRALDRLRREGPAAWGETRPMPTRLLWADAAQPAPCAALPAMAGALARVSRRLWEKASAIDQWFLGWHFDDGQRTPPALGEFNCLWPPADHFWADPFPLVREGRHYIFFEDLPFARGRAHIACLEIAPDGRCSEAREVLRQPYHLSYPFLIEEGGTLYMIPESGMNGSVELYRCRRFPDDWELVRVLLSAPCCADASVVRHGRHWWMFVNLGSNGGDVHDELHLYFADRLDGHWRPHPANPVKCDARGARPAGRPYLHQGQLYRPAQIGAPLYGSGIVLNRVLTLDEHDYREEAAARILPAPGGPILGVHTLNRSGRLSVIDGFTRRPRLGRPRFGQFSPVVDIAREGRHGAF